MDAEGDEEGDRGAVGDNEAGEEGGEGITEVEIVSGNEEGDNEAEGDIEECDGGVAGDIEASKEEGNNEAGKEEGDGRAAGDIVVFVAIFIPRFSPSSPSVFSFSVSTSFSKYSDSFQQVSSTFDAFGSS